MSDYSSNWVIAWWQAKCKLSLLTDQVETLISNPLQGYTNHWRFQSEQHSWTSDSEAKSRTEVHFDYRDVGDRIIWFQYNESVNYISTHKFLSPTCVTNIDVALDGQSRVRSTRFTDAVSQFILQVLNPFVFQSVVLRGFFS